MNTSRQIAAALSFILLVGLIGAPIRTAAQNASSTATHLFWVQEGLRQIGRAKLDGTEQNLGLVTGITAGGISVSGGYMYWATGTTIARATVTGADVNLSYVPTTNAGNVLVAGNYIYWTNYSGEIGRANLDGSNRNPNFITGIGGTDDIASDGTYLYFCSYGDNRLGRAKLDGTEPNYSFIDSAQNCGGVTVTSDYVFWTNYNTGSVGRANIDGTGKLQDFISTGVGTNPYGLVADDSYLYWTNGPSGAIGRANLDGTNVNLTFISGAVANATYGIALGEVTEPPVNTAAPTITGTAKVDASLTVAKGTWSGLPAPTYGYQWYRCTGTGTASDTVPSGCSAIGGATSATYKIDDPDYGKYLRVRVIGTNAYGSDTKFSATTAKVAASIATNTSSPTISGTTTVNSTLAGSKGIWTGYPAPTFTYQWLRCSASGVAADALPSGCTAISGATSTTYKVDDVDYGKYLRLKVVGTNSLGADMKYSAATSKIAGLDPVNTGAPTISGTPKVGTTVTGAKGTWTGLPTPTISYQWFRCTAAGSASATQPTGCTLISAATSSTYKLVTADKTAGYLRVRVTGTSAEGSAVRFSAAVKVQ